MQDSKIALGSGLTNGFGELAGTWALDVAAANSAKAAKENLRAYI